MCIRDQNQIRNRLKKLHPRPEGPGICPICKEETTKWVLDHCHQTNTFRGYICDHCNLGLGLFNDDPGRVLAAHIYLKGHTSHTPHVTTDQAPS